MWYISREFSHNKATTSQIYERAGACIIQILQELILEPALLKINIAYEQGKGKGEKGEKERVKRN